MFDRRGIDLCLQFWWSLAQEKQDMMDFLDILNTVTRSFFPLKFCAFSDGIIRGFYLINTPAWIRMPLLFVRALHMMMFTVSHNSWNNRRPTICNFDTSRAKSFLLIVGGLKVYVAKSSRVTWNFLPFLSKCFIRNKTK